MKRPDYTPRPRPRRNYASHFPAKSTPTHSNSPFATPFAPLAGRDANARMRRRRDCGIAGISHTYAQCPEAGAERKISLRKTVLVVLGVEEI